MSGPRHPGTEGNDLWPADVKFPDPDGGDGRLSLVNDVAAEFSGLAISSTQPTDMPDGGLWVNLSAEATAADRLSTYDGSTDAFIPIQADSTVVQDSEPAHSKGLIWFDSSPEDGFDMFFSDGETWYFLQFIPEIPDSVEQNMDGLFAMTEGSGATQLADSFGDVTATINNGGSWVTGPEWYEDTAPEFVEADGDHWVTDNQIDLNGSNASVAGWVSLDNLSTEVVLHMGDQTDESEDRGDGWYIRVSGPDDVNIVHGDLGGAGASIAVSVTPSTSLTTGTQYLFCGAVDGDTANLYVYDGNEKLASGSGSGSRTTTAGTYFYGMREPEQSSVSGRQDFVMWSSSSTVSESAFDQIHADTRDGR